MAADTLTLPEGDFRAYLFDLDGTIADSMPQHFVAWTKAIEEHGGTFPENLFYEWAGVTPFNVVKLLNEKFGYTMDPISVVADKESQYLLGIGEVKPIASVLAHIVAMYGRIPLAVVSGSPCETIHKTLDALHLTDKFQVLVGAEDYTKGKPDPEPFLKATEKLGIAPEDCLVFEDADAGIAAAKAAGMKWVRVPVILPGAASPAI